MKTKNQPCGTQTQSTPKTTLQTGDLVCLGIDQHADSLVVVEQINACVPRAARRFTKTQSFYQWVEERLKAGARVVACYEAGPCGYWLQRALSARGVECLVVAPKKWAENGKTKTDDRDARVLCERLFQWVGGKTNVFTRVSVPSEEEERLRHLSRNRERLLKERKRLAQAGRGLALGQQMRLKGAWWKGKRWTELASTLEELLGPIREVLLTLETQIAKLTTQLESHAVAREARPAGLGKLTDAVVSAEVGDYQRFRNRRGPGAYFGLVPGEDSSGGRRRQLPITKTGSGTVRRYLVEAAWRLIRFQPRWWAWVKRRESFEAAPKWRRNQIVVGLARQLAVDLWRLRTGQTTMERLGWEIAPT